MKIRKFLQKLAWKTNRWDIRFGLLNVHLGGDRHKFGFSICNIHNGFSWEGSLFEITWYFPTVTHSGELRIDLLFLFEKWDNWCIDMIDRDLWGGNLNWWERINLKINRKFKSFFK